MALKIGFANKYYTLWEHSVNYRTNERGISFRTDHYHFLHNASKDLNKALAKYPDAVFDETLRGRRGSWTFEKRLVDYNKYHCGKYMGILFTASTDYNYMMWFYNNCANDEQKKVIETVLIPEGYEVVEHTYSYNDDYDGHVHTNTERQIISPEDVKARKEQEEREMQGKARLAKGIPFVVTMERNLDEYGEYLIRDLEIRIRFENFKTNYYEGYYYGLPIDKKGKAKRVKHKQLLIENYELIDDTTALVKEWRFA